MEQDVEARAVTLARLRPFAELADEDARVLETLWARVEAGPVADDELRYVAKVSRDDIGRLEKLRLIERDGGRLRLSLLGLLQLGQGPEPALVLETLDALLRYRADHYAPRAKPVRLREVARTLGLPLERVNRALPFFRAADLSFTEAETIADAHLHLTEPIHRTLEEQLVQEAALFRPHVALDPLPDSPGPFALRVDSLEVEGFRVLRRLSLALPSPLTVLVGVNSAGKSTVLDAFAFVARAVRSGLPRAIRDEGGFERLRTSGTAAPLRISVGFSLDPGFGRTRARYGFTLSDEHGVAMVEDESLVVQSREGTDERWLRARRAELELLTTASDVRHAYKSVDTLALTSTSAHGYGLTMASLSPFRGPTPEEDPPTALAFGVRVDLSRVVLVDRDPLIRDATDSGEPTIGPLGRRRHTQPMRALLADAIRTTEHADELGRVLAELVPGVRGAERVVVTGAPAELRVLERGREAPSTLEELSAGTRQMLLLAALYVHSAPPALILLEEPDSGMHVGALSALRDLLRSLSARSVVVATSHSPAFVSLLDAEKEVVVLERGDERIDARSLARARESKQWLAQFESPFEAFVREGMSR